MLRRPIRALLLALFVVFLSATSAQSAGAREWRDPTERGDTPHTTSIVQRGPVRVAHTWYTAWNGRSRPLVIAYPTAYEPARYGRATMPLVIAIHGAAGTANCDVSFANAPARLGIAVACIGGQGVVSRGFSYGAPGQLSDQLRVPELVRAALPHVPIDQRHVIVAGTSMGGLEALLLADAAPNRFAAVIALDPPVDLALHFARQEQLVPDNVKVQALVAECGGTPDEAPDCYASRSPIHHMQRFGLAKAPLVVWFSVKDPIAGSPDQAPQFLRTFRADYPHHTLRVLAGTWQHGRAWWSLGYQWLVDALALAERR